MHFFKSFLQWICSSHFVFCLDFFWGCSENYGNVFRGRERENRRGLSTFVLLLLQYRCDTHYSLLTWFKSPQAFILHSSTDLTFLPPLVPKFEAKKRRSTLKSRHVFGYARVNIAAAERGGGTTKAANWIPASENDSCAGTKIPPPPSLQGVMLMPPTPTLSLYVFWKVLSSLHAQAMRFY